MPDISEAETSTGTRPSANAGMAPKMTLADALGLFRADLARRSLLREESMSAWNVVCALTRPGVISLGLLRFGNWLHSRGWRIAYRLVERLIFIVSRSELQIGAQIGPGLVLPDEGTVGIADRSRIGACVTFFSQACVITGPANGAIEFGIGDHCVIGRRAKIFGEVLLKEGIQVKDNSVVMTSFTSPGMIASGIPARRRGQVPIDQIRGWNPLKSRLLSDIGQDYTTMHQSFRETLNLIRADLDQRCVYEKKRLGVISRAKLLFHPGGASVALFRWQTFFDRNWLKPLGALCRWLNLVVFGSNYSSQAQVAGGLVVVHAMSICIGEGVDIASRCTMFGQTTIVRSPFLEAGADTSTGAPMVESDVIFGMGACAQGNIRIGAGCRIGMNTLVNVSAPAGSSLLGVPARVTGLAEGDPA